MYFVLLFLCNHLKKMKLAKWRVLKYSPLEMVVNRNVCCYLCPRKPNILEVSVSIGKPNTNGGTDEEEWLIAIYLIPL